MVFPLGSDPETTASFWSLELGLPIEMRLRLPITGGLVWWVGRPTGPGGSRSAVPGDTVFEEGDIPVAQRVDENRGALAPVLVPPNVACACVRNFAAKSCGGFREGTDCTPKCERPDGVRLCAGGTAALSQCRTDADCGFPAGRCGQVCDPTLGDAQCPEGFSCKEQDAVCAAEGKTCEYVHGPGNSASGVISCGLRGASSASYGVTSDPVTGECTVTDPVFSSPPQAGAAFLQSSLAMATILEATCEVDRSNPSKGPDGRACTDDDPEKGQLQTVIFTTGSVWASPLCPPFRVCTAAVNELQGAPFQCSLEGPGANGAALVAGTCSREIDPFPLGGGVPSMMRFEGLELESRAAHSRNC